jgi:hypothetical protein
MASGRLAALGVNAASNSTARQKKAAARRKEDTSRIVLKSYAEGPSAQTISQSVLFSSAGCLRTDHFGPHCLGVASTD